MAFYGKQSRIIKIHSKVTFVFYLTKQVRQVTVAGTSSKILAQVQKVKRIIKYMNSYCLPFFKL